MDGTLRIGVSALSRWTGNSVVLNGPLDNDACRRGCVFSHSKIPELTGIDFPRFGSLGGLWR